MTTSEKPTRARRRIGLKDIAREAEVSISTVSHVINGTAKISDEVRARVLRIAQELGHFDRQRMQRQGVRLKRLLVAVPGYGMAESEANLFLWSILSALRTHCDATGVEIVPLSSSDGNLDAEEVVEAVARERCDAIMLMHDDRPELLRPLARARADLPPMILVNGEDPEMEIDTVVPQNRFAARQAVRWLTGLGHRNILHITWAGRTTIERRRDGYLDALAELGRDRAQASIIAFPAWDLVMAERILSDDLVRTIERDGITAIFCASDNVALHARGVLHRAGLRVPEDISIVGFDNLIQSDMSSPPLSSVDVPVKHIGPTALQLLRDRLTDPPGEPAPARRIELGCSLVRRPSVAAPAKETP
ncbi:LacI family DNA-binding transcriptional regulator [Palleronia sp. LCG004]|uniref:LacI family DNA-binding transcriptional regulator n=1 Tax=Palleronia sp. LCG004 TaxID=3079304 RepID=UPI0029437457|nr:LacI family DNA-binding transcriptional regulator [Palleronia sp. LCG004]WOI55873.1 LacI family DNA-binding transcriptional regulator [Palleronia sp. LCG004]